MSDHTWYCFFEDVDGNVLLADEGWGDPDRAAAWGRRILDDPESFTLLDAVGNAASATAADPEKGVSVELLDE